MLPALQQRELQTILHRQEFFFNPKTNLTDTLTAIANLTVEAKIKVIV